MVSIDVDRVLTTGNSASRYISLMVGLLHPDEVRACAAAYPSVDLKDPHFAEGPGRPTLGVGPLTYGVVEEHGFDYETGIDEDWMAEGLEKIVTSQLR